MKKEMEKKWEKKLKKTTTKKKITLPHSYKSRVEIIS